MLLDGLIADAKFVGDIPICHPAQAVHQEYAPGLSRQGAKRPPVRPPQFHNFNMLFLLGRYGCIASFVELTCDASLAHNLARSLDQQIMRYSRQIGTRIFDPIKRAAAKQPRESFLHEIGRGITPDPPPEIMEQPPSLGAIEGSEISPRTGRGKRCPPFSIGGAFAPDICTGQHCATVAARQRAKACTIW
nr:hypothetical protein [Sphingopyxis terrae]